VQDTKDQITDLNYRFREHRKELDGISAGLRQTSAGYRTAFERQGTFGTNELADLKNTLFLRREETKELIRANRERDKLAKRAGGGGGGRGGRRTATPDIPEFGNVIETGRQGLKPMTLLVGAIVAISPALLALASSAAYASTSLVALAPAALGAVTAFASLGIAFKDIAGAWKDLDQVAKGSAAATKDLEDRIARMSPAARVLFGQLVALKNGFRGFQQQVQAATLPGFTSLLISIQDKGKQGISTLGLFKNSIIAMGAAISKATAQAGRFLASGVFKGALAKVIKNNQTAFTSLNGAVLALLEPLTRVFAGASPLVARFAAYLDKVANAFADMIAGFGDNQIEKFFRGAGDELAKWWKLAVNLSTALFNIMKAALPSGSTLVDRLVAFTAAIKDWTTNADNVRKLQDFFNWFANLNYTAIVAGITAIGGALLTVKAAPAIASVLTTLTGTAVSGGVGAVIVAGLLAIGAAAVTAYEKIGPFRDLVNEAAATLSRMWSVIVSDVKPALDTAFAELGNVLRDNNAELESMLHLFEQLGPAIGTGVGLAIEYLASQLAFLIDTVGVLYKAWLHLQIFWMEGLKFLGSGVLDLVNAVLWLGLKLDELNEKASHIPALGPLFGRPEDNAAAVQTAKDQIAAISRAREEFRAGADSGISVAQHFLDEANAPPGAKPKTAAEAVAQTLAAIKAKAAAASAAAATKTALPTTAGKAAAGVIQLDPNAVQNAKDQSTQAGRSLRDARNAVIDAQAALAKGQRDEAAAQRELTQARKDAAKNLRDLRVEVQGLAADEQDARLKLAFAQEKLKSIEFTNAVDPLIRRSIQNDVTQAQADLADKTVKHKDAQIQLVDAEKAGIENAPNVLQAKQRLADVTAEQAKNVRELRKAQDDARIATNGLTTAQNALTTAVNNFNASVAKIPPKKSLTVSVTPIVNTPEELIGKDPKTGKSPTGFVTIVELQKILRGATSPKLAATGGPIVGPRGIDKVPAMLTHGEYVTKADATAYYGSRNMAAINAKMIPRSVLEHYGYETPRHYATGGYVWPLPGYHHISSYFNENRGSYNHGGNDIPAARGTAILAAAAGRVIQAGWYGGGGNTVSIASAGGLVLRYMHMLRILSSLGQVIQAGQRIGLVDSTGDSTGDHLHFQAERPEGRKFNSLSLFGGAIPDTGPIPGLPAGAGVAGLPATMLTKYGATLIATLAAKEIANQIAVQTANTLGAKQVVPPVTKKYVLAQQMDQGGTLAPGPTLVLNRTGRPETVRNAQQEAALNGRTIRLDKRDIQLLASMLAVANAQRPLEMDGVTVAKQLASKYYLPPGV
jgi:murein DD-endopeptidase MepM/ murein hydrolase activator NlpD